MAAKWRTMTACAGLAAVMVLSACSKNPTEPDQPGGSEFAQIASTNGAEVFRGVQTLATLRRAQAGPRAYGKINLPAVGSMANSGRMLGERLAPFHQSAAKLQSLRKANGDSLIYEEWKIDLLTGINYHTRLYYDFATGKARLVVVASNFPATEPVVRDSAHIVVQTNFTLPDTADDVVERVDVRRDYRANYRLQFESGTLVPDAYEPGGEPAGGMIDARRVFAANQDSAEAVYHLEYHAGTGGNFSESVRFEDGTRYQANARFTEGQVLITINFRDGAVEQSDVTLEGPNRLRFNKTVTFAPGADPRSLYESGDLAVNPADSSATANFRREIFYANGTSLREELQASETRHNGLRRVTVSASSSKGTSCDWVWQEGVEKDRLEGSAIDEQQHYILFSGDFYRDGSADLHLEVYASKAAYDAGEPPIFTADLHYRPDGSGSGTVNSREGVKTFHFDANASLRS